MAGNRQRRINGEMQKILADIIRSEMKDPRISIMTSVLRVDVTNDLSYATAYISVYDTEDMQKSTIAALEHALGFLRTEVGKRMNLRKTPEIRILEDHGRIAGVGTGMGDVLPVQLNRPAVRCGETAYGAQKGCFATP